MPRRWQQVAPPQLRPRRERFTMGNVISAAARDGDLGDLAPVVALNLGNRGVGLYLPYQPPVGPIMLDEVYGARFDPVAGGFEAVVDGGRLKIWLLRWPGESAPVGQRWHDLFILDCGYALVEVPTVSALERGYD